jgi:hypothetical protein
MTLPTKKLNYMTCFPSILPVISDLFNSTECFTKDWKQAEVVAHPKEGDHEVAYNNYQ